MQTSIDFSIRMDDAFSCQVLKAIYGVLPVSGRRWLEEAERELTGDTAGGLYDLIWDLRSIRYILAKYSISGVAFSVRGFEHRDAGYMGLVGGRYENNQMELGEAGYCVYNDDPEDGSDLTFVVTGKLKYFANREELTEYIEEEVGGRVTGSISKKTNYLINNDSESDSSKNRKAKELGIPIITEKELLLRFGNPYYTEAMEELGEEYEEQMIEQAESELCPTALPDGEFWTEIWKIDPFDPTPIDQLDEKLRQAFADQGISVA